MSTKSQKISFVIPCYNSENTILPVIQEICDVVNSRPNITYEIITVIDGSPDNVAQILHDYAKDMPELKVVELARNFSKGNALMAGFHYATGDCVVTMDDDGQCPIDQVWLMVDAINDGNDMVVAKYKKKKQSPFKNLVSKLNNYTAHVFSGYPKNFEMSNFYAFNDLILTHIIEYKSPYPFISGFAFRHTTRIVNIDLEERPRISGHTNYSLRKMLAQWLNGFTSFSVKPLRIADAIGMLCALVGFIFGLVTVIAKIANANMLAGYPSLIAAILFVGGIIMILLGIIGEYIGRIFLSINCAPQFVVRATSNINEPNCTYLTHFDERRH